MENISIAIVSSPRWRAFALLDGSRFRRAIPISSRLRMRWKNEETAVYQAGRMPISNRHCL